MTNHDKHLAKAVDKARLAHDKALKAYVVANWLMKDGKRAKEAK